MTTRTLRPILTTYRGRRFRSRLEARWAVFWDAMNLVWTYEPEPYDVEGRGYLPDFAVPELALLVEVKPPGHIPDDARYMAAAEGLRGRLLLIAGEPWIGDYSATLYDWRLGCHRRLSFALGRRDHAEVWLARTADQFAVCLNPVAGVPPAFPLIDAHALLQAYRTASGWRFDPRR